MAQEVGYGDDNVVFQEGPFVICGFFTGWRIEAHMDGHGGSVLPDLSIYEIERKFGLEGKSFNKELVIKVCDILNQMVREGKIIIKDGVWVCPN